MSRRKKTFAQKIVNAATTGMPSSIRKYLGGRFVSLLLVLTIPLTLATGIVSISWQNGRPKLAFDQQKAAEVKDEAAERFEEIRGEQHRSIPDLVPSFGGQDNTRSGFGINRHENEGFGAKVAERAEALKERFDADRESVWSRGDSETAESPNEQASGPLSRLKQRWEDRR